ncbi:hypothetical protein EV426DRAFT_701967 [Tirmania nivea]|nr:hypothetical protein EV426DRAFT_701967 [Tirmania nivea]
MPRNRKANRPRYETPDPGQLPTPKQTPGAGSSAKKGPRKLEERLEQERQEREVKNLMRLSEKEQGSIGSKEEILMMRKSGGYLDSEDEEMLDKWSRENESEVFHKMGIQNWKTVAIFLLEHVVRLVEGVGLEEAPPGTGLAYVQAILGKDGSVAFEGRDELGDKVGELLVKLSLKPESEEDYSLKMRELSKTKREYENVMRAVVEENMDLKK